MIMEQTASSSAVVERTVLHTLIWTNAELFYSLKLGQTWYYVIFICISLASGEADFIYLYIAVFIFLDIFISYNIRELYICACAKSLQSCLTLCDPTDCSPPGSSVHGLLQARILEWVAIPFSSRSFPFRDQTWLSCTADRFFTIWATIVFIFFIGYLYFLFSFLKYFFDVDHF